MGKVSARLGRLLRTSELSLVVTIEFPCELKGILDRIRNLKLHELLKRT